MELFDSTNDAAAAWADVNLPLSREFEHGSLIYRVFEDGRDRFFSGPVFRGENPKPMFGKQWFPPNVIRGFIWSYLFKPRSIPRKARVCGFIHSHPQRYTNVPSSGDRFVAMLPGIKREYIAPYNNRAQNNVRFFSRDGRPEDAPPCFCLADYRWKKSGKQTLAFRRDEFCADE